MYAEMTNKAGRKLQKRLLSYSQSKSSYSDSRRAPSAVSSVGNDYSDSDNGEGNKLFVTKMKEKPSH